MDNAISAVADLASSVPVKLRRTLYGLFGLLVLFDSIWNVLPDGIDNQVLATFGVFNSVLALANTSGKPLPPPLPADDGKVTPAFPDEFA